jgi:hypothetical protein
MDFILPNILVYLKMTGYESTLMICINGICSSLLPYGRHIYPRNSDWTIDSDSSDLNGLFGLQGLQWITRIKNSSFQLHKHLLQLLNNLLQDLFNIYFNFIFLIAFSCAMIFSSLVTKYTLNV